MELGCEFWRLLALLTALLRKSSIFGVSFVAARAHGQTVAALLAPRFLESG